MAKNRRFSYLLLTLGEAFEAKKQDREADVQSLSFWFFCVYLA